MIGIVGSAEIGIGLTGFGFVLTFLGVLFFFDKGLLAMGNVSVAAPMHITDALSSWALMAAC